MNHRTFIPPPIVKSEKKYLGYESYSHYNYLRPGISSKIKIWHFEAALALTSNYPSFSNVIDFGCADGCLLPSLSKYFEHVVGIDDHEDMLNIAKIIVNYCELNNVKLINNENMRIEDISKMIGRKYDILFLLEVIEHVGDKANPYESRMGFIEELFKLADAIVISIPRMTGISFLIQRIGLQLLNQDREKISKTDFLKAVLFSETSNLEKKWVHRHLGFSDKKFEHHLREKFNVEHAMRNLFQDVYLVRVY
jgi:hypothetical protein